MENLYLTQKIVLNIKFKTKKKKKKKNTNVLRYDLSCKNG